MVLKIDARIFKIDARIFDIDARIFKIDARIRIRFWRLVHLAVELRTPRVGICCLEWRQLSAGQDDENWE